MERIVSGLAKINFQQNCEDILIENRMENIADRSNEMAGTSSYAFTEQKFNDSTTADSDLESDFNSSNETAIVGDDDADSSCSGSSTNCASISQRRNLPRRACKENSSLKLKRRSIMKPKRHTSRLCDFSMLRPAEIKKIYCNQKLTCFRRTNLETIFEEPQLEGRRSDAAIVSANTSLRFIGLKKIKRSLSCSDGLNTNKTLIKQRRAKIKKIFGRRNVCKKISLSDFIDRLNKNFDDDADIEDAGLETDDNIAVAPEEVSMEAEMNMNVTSETDTSDLNDSSPAQNSSTYGNSTTSSSSNKTEFTMLLGTGMSSSMHEYNTHKNIENGSPFLLQNTYGTLGYSRDAVTTTGNLGGSAEKKNFLASKH
ncbi:protein tantalus [Eurosta solidaginis]|uniref:protein tantalus n=1 Tax=Eurosta solidaginis TaxID=178769 RepID=UPI0035308080